MTINQLTYKKVTDFFKNNKVANSVLKIAYKLLPIIIFASYPALLLIVCFYYYELFFKILLVPAGVFTLVTTLRIMINEQRPYEKYKIESVFAKTTSGKSMPSRHTASAFVIAMAFLRVNVPIGIVFLVMAFLIMCSRICAGVHYIRDVVAGATISIVAGIVFIFLI